MKFPPLTSALLLFSACSAKPAADWSSIRDYIARVHPDVEHITTEELYKRLEAPGGPPLLLDARTLAEFNVSHLPGAHWAPSRDAAHSLLADVPEDREIVVYCSVGVRSAELARELESDGFRAVRNLDGSLFAWANAGYPLVSASTKTKTKDGELPREITTHVAHPYDENWGRLLSRELWEWNAP